MASDKPKIDWRRKGAKSRRRPASKAVEIPAEEIESCPTCNKRLELCICASLTPIATRHEILILQHPQEPDKDLGTARIANLSLKNSELRIGLSWPNIKKALGRDAVSSRWGVLYLGSGINSKVSPEAGPPKSGVKRSQAARTPGLHFVDKKGSVIDPSPLDGIVILDGTWSQAKALWWRNAWLLKLKRLVLVPSHPSLYRELRKEPRKECLSTLESIADSLQALGDSTEAAKALRTAFEKLLDKKRESRKKPKIPAAEPQKVVISPVSKA